MPSSSSLSAALRAAAEAHPKHVAVLSGDQALTYGGLQDGTARLAGFLVKAGVQPGDRVLVFSENRPEYLMALFACSRVGALLTTVYPSFGRDEIEYIIGHCTPSIALVEPDQRSRFDEATGSGLGFPTHDLVEAAAATSPAAPVVDDLARGPEDAVLICYTSGTSSRPKAVLHSNAGLLAASRLHVATWGVTPDDRLLVMTPMAWLFGLVTTSLTGLAGGATVVLMPHFHPVRALELIQQHRVTVLMGVGAMYAKLTEAAEALDQQPLDDVHLRLCLSGGENRNAPAIERFRKLYDCPVHDIYAASECFPIISYDPQRDPEPHPTAAGRVVRGAEVRIVDPEGVDVPRGEVGELIARSAASMLGYYQQPELTRSVVDAEGWFHTRDLARIDEEGLVHIVGRVSDMIIRGGANISPAEVERVLSSHPEVVEVAVVGLPDEVYGQQVAAFVLPSSPSLTSEAAIEYAASRLAKYKVPTVVELVDQLPRTATGKVQRSALVRP